MCEHELGSISIERGHLKVSARMRLEKIQFELKKVGIESEIVKKIKLEESRES